MIHEQARYFKHTPHTAMYARNLHQISRTADSALLVRSVIPGPGLAVQENGGEIYLPELVTRASAEALQMPATAIGADLKFPGWSSLNHAYIIGLVAGRLC
jgi:hypothetical protein